MKKKADKPAKKPGPAPVAQNVLENTGIEIICDMIAEGKTYRQICRHFGVGLASLNRWMEADPERSHACARAREAAAQSFDELAQEGLEQAADPFALAKAKEVAIHLRWRAKVVNPKKYGDRTTLAGDADNPLSIVMEQIAANPKSRIAVR